MKRVMILVLASVVLFLWLGSGCSEPQECKDLKAKICEICGDDSDACKSLEDKYGKEADKCKEGLDAMEKVEGLLKSDAGKESFCSTIAEDK